jgi:hypothetical protein
MKSLLKYMLALNTFVFFSGCGGGAGTGGGGGIESNPLLKYEGVFYSCEDNYKTTLTLTATGTSSLSATMVNDIYASDNCSGNILATYRLRWPSAGTFKSRTTATMPAITLLPFSDLVDEVTTSSENATAELSGNGIVGNCVKYSYKNSTGIKQGESCFQLDFPAASGNAAFYLTSNGQYLVQFSRENGVLSADGITSKSPNFNYNQLTPD